MKRFGLALDLKDDPELIQEYEAFHREVWPDVLDSLGESGIRRMDIYRAGTRLFMVIETSDDFSLERKQALDQANPAVQRWETLMDTYQQRLPGTPEDQKWTVMDRVFEYVSE